MLGKINAQTVFNNPALDTILNRGIIVATCGIIIAKNNTENN